MKFVFALCFTLSLTAPAADWPRFRGPTGDDATPDLTIPLKWSEKENLVWRTELPGPALSRPIHHHAWIWLKHTGHG